MGEGGPGEGHRICAKLAPSPALRAASPRGRGAEFDYQLEAQPRSKLDGASGSGACNDSEIRRSISKSGNIEIGVIEQVVEFTPQFKLHAFSQLECFLEREIRCHQ